MKYYGVVWSYGNNDQLEHFGIKGMRWGIRRYQNEDGTLTELGKKRYTYSDGTQSKMNDRGRRKFGNRYADDYDAWEKMKASAKEAKAIQNELDKEAYKKYTSDDSMESKVSKLNDRMASFDKANADEKFAILDEVIKAQNALRGSGDYDKEYYNRLNDFFMKNREKAGEARLKEYEALPKGEERDKKLTQLLVDSQDYGQDSEYVGALVDRMQAKHGDYLSRNFKTEAARKAAEEADAAMNEETRIGDQYYKQDQKLGKYKKDPYGSSFFVLDKLAADHPEVKAAMDNRESKWEKYCEQVLKDMDMPINEDTISAIMSVIIWN